MISFKYGQVNTTQYINKLGVFLVKDGEKEENREWIETISWTPRVFLYHNILTEEECEHIITMGKNSVYRSEVVKENNDVDGVDDARTSFGVFLTGTMARDEVVLKLQKKIAHWTHLPEENGEAFYLLRYEIGQQYKPHTDYFTNPRDIGNGGNRIATVLAYLGGPEEGGETIFPNAKPHQIRVQPERGSAILFWDFMPENSPDILSLHGGLPVLKGTKWALTKWLHHNAY